MIEVENKIETVMQKPWFEKHRPETIDDIVFESPMVEEKIRQFIAQGYISGNIISYGPGGTGKTTVNKVLAWAIIKSEADIHILGKGVKGVEDLKKWITEKAQNSKQKIVICEEFDKTSKEAQIMLKDGLMEKYMPKVSFLCTTNNIAGIDPALLQRFNIKLNFNAYNIDGVFERCKKILEVEQVTYDPNEVYHLVMTYANKGIRDLINNLEYGTINKTFKLSNIDQTISGTSIEDTLISWIKYIFAYVEALEINACAQTICYPTSNADIGPYWSALQKQMSTDGSVNYEYIFKTLTEDEGLALFIKHPLNIYYNKLDSARIKSTHLSSCIFEAMVEIYTVKGGTQNIIHTKYI